MDSRQLVLLRHGQSAWNAENRFTGWTDIDLSKTGMEESRRAGQLLREARLDFDVAYTSVLKRAIRTLWIVLEEMDRMWVPQNASWRLNERHYGALQGRDKSETAARLGADAVQQIRRGFWTRPPLLDPGDARNPVHDRRYSGCPADNLPLGESLADTVDRVLPYWVEEIAPALRAGARVLVSAHGNSLRALIMHLYSLSQEAVEKVEIPTGLPLICTLGGDLSPLEVRYLGTAANTVRPELAGVRLF